MKEIKTSPIEKMEENTKGKSLRDCAIWKKTKEVVNNKRENVQMAKKLCSIGYDSIFLIFLLKNIFYFIEKDANNETNPHKIEPHIVSVIVVFNVYFSIVE